MRSLSFLGSSQQLRIIQGTKALFALRRRSDLTEPLLRRRQTMSQLDRRPLAVDRKSLHRFPRRKVSAGAGGGTMHEWRSLSRVRSALAPGYCRCLKARSRFVSLALCSVRFPATENAISVHLDRPKRAECSHTEFNSGSHTTRSGGSHLGTY
jgi:hypothetical protein